MRRQDLEVVLSREAHGLNGIHHKIEGEDPFGASVNERVVDTRNQEVRNDGGEPRTGSKDHPLGGMNCRHRSSHAGGSCGFEPHRQDPPPGRGDRRLAENRRDLERMTRVGAHDIGSMLMAPKPSGAPARER